MVLGQFIKKGFWNGLLSEKPDILCIQETKATRKQFPKDIKGC